MPQAEKDMTRLMQGIGLVVSRIVELRTAHSAGLAAEARWSNAASAAAAGHAPVTMSTSSPPAHHHQVVGEAAGGLQQTSDDAEARKRLEEALSSERRARIAAEGQLIAERLRISRMMEEEKKRARSLAATRAPGPDAAAPAQRVESPTPPPVQQHAQIPEGAASAPASRTSATSGIETEGKHTTISSSAASQADAAPKPQKNSESPSRRSGIRESSVPTSPFMRVAQFGVLGMGMGIGVLGEAVRRTMNGTVVSGGGFKGMVLGGSNSDRLTETLCRMRGAALKLGQLLSIQDEHVIPKDSPLRAVIDRVREEAEHMPASQFRSVMVAELGASWREKFREFDETPFAAASIGQVHRAVTHDGDVVAVKVQYPGVAQSIDADIGTLGTMLAPLAPRGMFLSTALEELRIAMKNECDYIKEAEMTSKMRRLLEGDAFFGVPKVYPDLSTKRVLTTEMLKGVPIDQVAALDQNTRDTVAKGMMRLTLKELFVLHTMQTDPNWSNFLYDAEAGKVNLIDFGASVEYPREFCVNYGRLVNASAERDRAEIIKVSREMGFLTGEESEEFLEAHASAAMITGEPFREGVYDFDTCSMTERNSGYIATMLAGRKTAPPRPVYTLHRKLSGAFLSSMKLKAKIECRTMFKEMLPAF